MFVIAFDPDYLHSKNQFDFLPIASNHQLRDSDNNELQASSQYNQLIPILIKSIQSLYMQYDNCLNYQELLCCIVRIRIWILINDVYVLVTLFDS